ncbi:hypothetical protein BO86DRAFT_426748 [Aspergillus japonicus CBS 114.51]|uniref:HCNGP-domain-containing protein n=2 Tax=Aspergillus TaxID=5052 RepID=A0A2V5IHE3_ASPV1|nr:hypothetical protein BO86DRAFT_426748 [Aspergillus japonicus CBS 114.51]PYI23337.1 hypothetical protein BO99DRAFT_463922 [Aspergillus violaceofuscus CBS 115571]RAH83405.1 hypothetical protein BO86DRAFT_426748 [Aspergillus japonicus CBS 114.51]
MLGLAAYDSSSEDDAGPNPISSETKQGKEGHLAHTPKATQNSEHGSMPESDRPVFGPSHESPHDAQKSSPTDYITLSASRTIIHDLTLPPVPNLDIPPSPPSSPDPSADAKFAHFLSLKKQGVHFNEKLSGSASLRNPSLLKAMMNHAGIDDRAQYQAALPPAIWNAPDLPSWGFMEEIRQAQRDIQGTMEERRSARQREEIAFVAATSSLP